MKVNFLTILLLTIILSACSKKEELVPNGLTLAWNASESPESEIEGYYIHHGPASGSYTTIVPVGKVTEHKFTELEPGLTFFVVTAKNHDGLESLPSNEISYDVPVNFSQNITLGPADEEALKPNGLRLAWNASESSEAEIEGYYIHHGPSSGNYTTTIPVGKVTEHKLTDLKPGLSYFVVSVKNRLGIESLVSNEISYDVPVYTDQKITLGPAAD